MTPEKNCRMYLKEATEILKDLIHKILFKLSPVHQNNI